MLLKVKNLPSSSATAPTQAQDSSVDLEETKLQQAFARTVEFVAKIPVNRALRATVSLLVGAGAFSYTTFNDSDFRDHIGEHALLAICVMQLTKATLELMKSA